jgi:hypothetical protein
MYHSEFLARNEPNGKAQLSTMAFYHKIHYNSKKIEPKTNRMMGWIENGPKNVLK